MTRTILIKDIEQFENLVTKAGYSHRGLAKEIGCSQTQISLIVKGERNPSPKTAANICKALNVDFDLIFFTVSDYKSNH